MSVTLTGVGSIVLPNPEFGDSDYNDQMNVVNRSRGGRLLVFSASRPTIQRKSWTFRHMSRDKIDALHIFLLANLGTDVAVNDYRGNTFNVIILTPDANTTNEGREMCTTSKGRRSISLELEVV